MAFSTKTHKRHERVLALNNKTPEQAIEAIRKAAEGLEGARLKRDPGYYYTPKITVTGWTLLTPDEIAEAERKRKTRLERQRKAIAAERQREQERRDIIAVRTALATAQTKKEAAETMARLLREQGYEIKKAPKGKVK